MRLRGQRRLKAKAKPSAEEFRIEYINYFTLPSILVFQSASQQQSHGSETIAASQPMKVHLSSDPIVEILEHA